MMVSIWWAVWMFFLGACAGTLVFALMSITAREGEQGVKEEQAVERDGLGPVKLDEEWTALAGSPSNRAGGKKAGKKHRRELEPA
jgi:hypothetical protein